MKGGQTGAAPFLDRFLALSRQNNHRCACHVCIRSDGYLDSLSEGVQKSDEAVEPVALKPS